MIRLLKISSYYDNFLKGFWSSKRPDLASGYDNALRELMEARFGWFDVWKRTLEGNGGFTVMEVVANDEITQRLWAKKENPAQGEASMRKILLMQIQSFRPDVIFANNVSVTGPEDWKEWGQIPIKKPVLFAYEGLGSKEVEKFREVDFVLTPLRVGRDNFRQAGVEAHLFRPAFPLECQTMESQEKDLEAVFIGSVGTSLKGHGPRLRFLHDLSKQADIMFYLSGLGLAQTSPLKQARRLFRGQWKDFQAVRRLGEMNQGTAFGRRMYETLGRSRVALNFHVASAGEEGVNMRLYEGTGMGACMLTENKPNLPELFKPDMEIVTYGSTEEAAEKIRWLIDHPREAGKIAKAGQARTQREHSLENQIRQVAERIKEKLAFR